MRILVVEDQPDLQRLLRACLEDESYAVDTAGNGVEGLAKALVWPYDVIILDLMLPKLDGMSLLEQLRERRSTPVLILSAKDALPDRVRGLDCGADDYLTKPFERSELLARIRAIIRRVAGQSQSTLVAGAVSVDLRSRTVCVDDAPIALTSREFSVLEYLITHQGRVVSREELLGHLSDEHDESNSNSLEVFISNIRRKIGATLIETRRGFGYVIPK
jgi:two-component system OmpR family response regulator